MTLVSQLWVFVYLLPSKLKCSKGRWREQGSAGAAEDPNVRKFASRRTRSLHASKSTWKRLALQTRTLPPCRCGASHSLIGGILTWEFLSKPCAGLEEFFFFFFAL